MLPLLLAALALGSPSPLETQLIAQIQARLTALASGDKRPWMRDLDTKALLMDEEGNVSSKAEFLGALRALPKGSAGTLVVTHPHFEQMGDVAVVAFIADEHETIFAGHFQARFGMTDTYRRVGSRWLLIADQQMRLPLDPPTVTLSPSAQAHYVGRYRMIGGPLVFVVKQQHGVLIGGRDGTPLLPLFAIADQPGAFFRRNRPGTLIFVGNVQGKAIRLIDRRYYNRDLTYQRI